METETETCRQCGVAQTSTGICASCAEGNKEASKRMGDGTNVRPLRLLDEVDDFLQPGPECFSCAFNGQIAEREPCRMLAVGKAEEILTAWEYRYVLASDPHQICGVHKMREDLAVDP